MKSLESASARAVSATANDLPAGQVEKRREFMIRSEVMSPIEIIRAATPSARGFVRRKAGSALKRGATRTLLVDGNQLQDLGLFKEQGSILSVIMKGRGFTRTDELKHWLSWRTAGWRERAPRSARIARWRSRAAGLAVRLIRCRWRW